MDINGGMSTDVYDSMAEGVSNAAVIVVFMSQKYQESANCMLELKVLHLHTTLRSCAHSLHYN